MLFSGPNHTPLIHSGRWLRTRVLGLEYLALAPSLGEQSTRCLRVSCIQMTSDITHFQTGNISNILPYIYFLILAAEWSWAQGNMWVGLAAKTVNWEVPWGSKGIRCNTIFLFFYDEWYMPRHFVLLPFHLMPREVFGRRFATDVKPCNKIIMESTALRCGNSFLFIWLLSSVKHQRDSWKQRY